MEVEHLEKKLKDKDLEEQREIILAFCDKNISKEEIEAIDVASKSLLNEQNKFQVNIYTKE
ncbi:hypothetical protein [Sedimenticola thiotaurini]|uniref:Uncharacterized protein n=1 Tax=Sedimenticola thiotaurini TaxID=1543721 RepID=A0A0F7K320_9GAMM|nr:hypothetical protein [Sedimenticola thiotaurini]AKH21595.1 hypothetical protein AAY24_15895 [Sedimenticola thiotaurini]